MIKRALMLTALSLVTFCGWASDRHSKALEVAHDPISLSLLDECSTIYFFYVGKDDNRHIEAYALNPDGDRIMQFVGAILPEGGPPNVVSVLTRNVDDDPAKEILVLSRWEIKHAGLDSSGNYYRTYVFDQAVEEKAGGGLKRLTAVENVIGEGFDGMREGQDINFPVKSAEALDRALEDLRRSR